MQKEVDGMDFLLQKDNGELNDFGIIQNLRADMEAAHENMERIQRDAVRMKKLCLIETASECSD